MNQENGLFRRNCGIAYFITQLLRYIGNLFGAIIHIQEQNNSTCQRAVRKGLVMEYPVLDPKKTGARIKELRKEKKIKVEDIARFMGFESEQSIYKWQRGESLPTVDNLFALSRLFGTTVDDILQGSEGAE